MSRNKRTISALLITLLLIAAGCSSDDDDAAGEVDADARCQANRDYGPVTFVTAFDYAAAAGIVEFIAADAEGYFEDLCIDVDIQPGFAPSNGALVIEGQAEMGVAGSFAEMVNSNVAGEGDLVALLHWGRTAIEAIVVPGESDIEDFGDLCGSLVGIKGDLPPSLQASVALSGAERSCFEETLLDGFDPIQHLDLGIDALPVYKSNEPNTLSNAGVEFRVLDPLDFNIPASFGIPFASRSFIEENPDLAQDMVRALVKGYEFADTNPEAAVDHAFELIDAAGNPNFLAKESELFRWNTERALVAELAPGDIGVGVPDLSLLEAEVDALVEAGLFEEEPPWRDMVDDDIATSVFDGTTLIWPGR